MWIHPGREVVLSCDNGGCRQILRMPLLSRDLERTCTKLLDEASLRREKMKQTV
jgi:hypothetical protein